MSFLDPRALLPALPVILLALTIHEWAHAYTANRFGDPTARLMGRMTLNPLAHLDLFGTLAIVLIGFGWAKPVPVNMSNLREPRRHMMWISAAGPISNLFQAAIFGVLLQIFGTSNPATPTGEFFMRVLTFGIFINCALAVFNLIPVPPLDGSKIMYGMFKGVSHETVWKMERYGPMVLMALIVVGYLTRFNIIWMIMGIPVSILTAIFSGGML